jgi:Ni/Fe-hydrogenase subunit HybB-like protein
MTQDIGKLSRNGATTAWISEKFLLGLSWRDYVKTLITPLNAAAGLILAIGLPFIVLRYWRGLGAVTAASDDQPFGLFLSWGLFSGVPMASTGFLLATAVYLFGLRDYKPLVRPAVLTGFVGYFFAVVFLLIDLGQPWRLPYPMIRSFGTGSVLFLVAWHVALYLSVQFLEFSPAVFEWLEARKLRAWAVGLTLGATIFGVILSTLHQSALGAMFLLAPGKLHPLWYTPNLPVLFFVSAIFCGLSVVILESTVIYRLMPNRVDPRNFRVIDRLTLGLGKAAAVTMFAYFCLKYLSVAHDDNWRHLAGPYGPIFLLETFGFVLLPCVLYLAGVRRRNASVVRWAALITVPGVILNRLNVTYLALNWNLPHRELFHGREMLIVATVVTIELLAYRWIVNRLPVHRESSRFADDH